MAALLSLLLVLVPIKPPIVNVTVPGKSLHSDAVKETKAAFAACDRTGTKKVRMVVHNQHAASVNRYTVDCATGKVTPATVNHVTVVTVPGRHHRADALKLATVALGLCDKRGGGVIPLVVHVTKSDHVFRVDYDCKALAFINPN